MSKLLSVLALSGNADAAVLQAADDVRAATLQLILHGNSRNITDTADALRQAKAVTQSGEIAKNRKGAILSVLLQAHDEAQSRRNDFLRVHTGHKGKPSADMTLQAETFAAQIAEAFEVRAKAAIAPKVKAPKADKAPAQDADKGKGEKRDIDADHEVYVSDLKKAFSPERARTAKRIKAMRQTIKGLRAELAALKQVRALVPTEKPVKRQSKVKEAVAA